MVRFIFDTFLAGYPLRAIAEILTEAGIPIKTGRSNWSEGSLNYILRNERYCGSILTWKTFTSDVFEHKKNGTVRIAISISIRTNMKQLSQ